MEDVIKLIYAVFIGIIFSDIFLFIGVYIIDRIIKTNIFNTWMLIIFFLCFIVYLFNKFINCVLKRLDL